MYRPASSSGKRADGTRTAILDAAEALFAERGFDATRLEDVAARVGIRRPSLMHHFRDKKALYGAVFSEVLADLRSRYAQALIPPGTHHERLDRFIDVFLSLGRERPGFLRLMLRELSGRSALPEGAFAAIMRSVLEPVRAAIHAGQAAGALRPADPTEVIFALFGVAMFLLVAAPTLTPEEYPHGIEPAHLDRLRADLTRMARLLLGPPGVRTHGRMAP